MAINVTELTNGTTVVKEVDGLNTPTWEGTAIFDVLVRIVNENLKIQYDAGRIKATDYAQAYIGGLQTCLTESMKYIMQKDNLIKDIEVKQANIDLTNQQKAASVAQVEIAQAQSTKDLAIKDKQAIDIAAGTALKTQQKAALIKDDDVKQANIDLLNRQKEGFDDNKHQKLFEAQMNAWALMFSSGLLETKPAIINNDSASALYNTLKPK